jgi:transcriptional regulator with XRE-family HTH domain
MSMSLQELIESSQDTMKDYQRERLEVEVTELICQLMEEKNISRAELARRLGKSRPYVTKLLRDGSNMTLKTISDVFFALGRSLRVVDRPLSIHSPRLLVMEASPEGARVVPGADYYFEHSVGQLAYSPAIPSVPYTKMVA